MDPQLLLRPDSVPRETPYYCFEFVLYDTRKSFGVFYETNFSKISRLFALGLARCMFFTNASKLPLDMKAKVVEKRFWWDFNYDKMERCGGHKSLMFDSGQRLGVFKASLRELLIAYLILFLPFDMIKKNLNKQFPSFLDLAPL